MSIINALVLHRIIEEESAFEDISTFNLSLILKNISTSFTLLGKHIETKASSRSWVVTFDDGNASDYEIVLPLLRKYNMKATFFIVTSLVGKPEYLNWEQIKCLDSEGMQIGSHSLSHKKMTRMPKVERMKELVSSRQLIEDHLGKTVKAFSFPFGCCNAKTIKEVFDSGYEFCCTSRHGIFSPEEKTIPRNSINGSMTENEISKILNASYGMRVRWLFEDTLKQILKLTLKKKSYNIVRTLFTR